jgi:hypothetical protein
MARWPLVFVLLLGAAGLSIPSSPAAYAEEPGSAESGEPDDPGGSEGDAKAAAKENQAPPAHPEGEYGGVVPGRPAPPPQASAAAGKPRPKPTKPTVTWLGFQPLEGAASRVFVQLSTQGSYSQSVVGKELVVRVEDVRLGAYNQTRPLDTRFFQTPVARVVARRVAKKGRGKNRTPGGVELRISFKDTRDVRASDAHIEAASDGYVYLYLDFGPATAPSGS